MSMHEQYKGYSVFITRLARRVPLVKKELLTIPEHMSSPPGFSGVHVARTFFFLYSVL